MDYQFGMQNNLQWLRELKGLSTEQLGEMVGWSHVTVWRHENGERDINTKKAKAYAEALGCEPADIISSSKKYEYKLVLKCYSLAKGALKMLPKKAALTKEVEERFLENLLETAFKEKLRYKDIKLTEESAYSLLESMLSSPQQKGSIQ